MNEYEARQEARRERYEARADAADAESTRRYRAAREIGSRMQGEPIKIGHHSERAHRADINRHDQNMRACCDEASKADHYRRKADAVGRGGISSDDPEALRKLRAKLATEENGREQMKATNAAWRKAGKPGPEDQDGWRKVADTLGRDVNDLARIRKTIALMPYNPMPFPPFSLSNLGANIRRIKQRIAEMEARTGCEYSKVVVGDVEVEEDPADNRIRLYFDGKPPDETRATLKRHGFRWSRRNMAWQRHLNNAGRAACGAVLSQIGERA